MRRVCCAAVMLALAAASAGCDEKLSDVGGPTPNLEPTFASIQQQIFDSTDSAGRRACTSCHNAAGARFAANLNLAEGVSYAALVNVASTQRPGLFRVQPGDPDASYLLHKIEGAPNIVGERMPRTSGPFLTDGQVLIIRRWIQIGAPNN
jgi:hypothetical protein